MLAPSSGSWRTPPIDSGCGCWRRPGSWRDVDDMMELFTQPPASLMPLGQLTAMRCGCRRSARRPACPLERASSAHAQARCSGFRTSVSRNPPCAPATTPDLREAVLVRRCAPDAVQGALGRGAVVSHDVHEDRVVPGVQFLMDSMTRRHDGPRAPAWRRIPPSAVTRPPCTCRILLHEEATRVAA